MICAVSRFRGSGLMRRHPPPPPEECFVANCWAVWWWWRHIFYLCRCCIWRFRFPLCFLWKMLVISGTLSAERNCMTTNIYIYMRQMSTQICCANWCGMFLCWMVFLLILIYENVRPVFCFTNKFVYYSDECGVLSKVSEIEAETNYDDDGFRYVFHKFS